MRLWVLSDLLAQVLARAAKNREKFGIQTEMGRIMSLIVQDFEPQGQELADKWTTKLRRTAKARPLRPVQGVILEVCHWAAQLDEPIGMLGNVGVGKGKTLAFWLMQEVFNAKRPVLMLPPSMRTQYDSELFAWSQDYTFRLPTVVYYSQLSRPDATSLLRELNPDLIMADEAHMLRHATAARTKRFLRFMAGSPDTRFVAMSGTLTGSTLSDYAHLARWALRDYSPLPRDERNVHMWGSVINSGGEPDELAWQTLAPLDQTAANRWDRAGIRRAFQKRLRTAPGVVTTQTPSCEAALTITATYPTISKEVTEALRELADDYILPNGLEIVDALHFHRAAAQLSNGFYYIWDWPDDIVDEEWVEARRVWWSMCRWYLTRYAREGCDSPFLVEKYVQETEQSPDMFAALLAWNAQKHKPPPPTKPIWIDPTPVMEAFQWAMDRDSALVWFQSKAVGDMLEACGMPRLTDGSQTPTYRDTPRVALSIPIFHKGRNLQAWDDNLVMEVPSSAATWEQLQGRTHRQGQLADEVKTSVFQHTWSLRQAFARALDRAEYIQQTTGQQQKLLLADRRDWR